MEVEIFYGGPATAYAAVQHEHDEFDHPNGGKAHFLSDPFDEAAATLEQDIEAMLVALLGGLR